MLLSTAPVSAFAAGEGTSDENGEAIIQEEQTAPDSEEEKQGDSSSQQTEEKQKSDADQTLEEDTEKSPAETPQETPEGNQEETPQETPEEVVSYTVTYYDTDGETALGEETVEEGGHPAQLPTAAGDGSDISAWLLAGSSTTPEKVTALTVGQDLSLTAWVKPQLSGAVHTAYVKGTGAGKFSPNKSLSRAEAVTMLGPLLDTAENGPYTTSFTDVDYSSWYGSYVELLASNDIIHGKSDTSFDPTASITRAEFVTILANIFPLKNEGKTYYVDENGLIPKLSSGVQEAGDALVYVEEDGSLLTSSSYGYLTFGADGAYTSGDSTLGQLVDQALAACTTPGASAETRLRQAYVYIRDNFTYLSRAHHARGNNDWTIESATFFLKNGKGNCYCFAGAFLYMARRLGFQAYPISGGVGSNNADHAWVMIKWSDGNTYLFDVELEYAYHHRYTGSRHNTSLDIYKKTRSQYPFSYHFPS